MTTDPRELQTKIVTQTTVPYEELDRFITLHIGKRYQSVIGGEWRNGSKNSVVLDNDPEQIAEHVEDVAEWLAGTGPYKPAKKHPYEQYPSVHAVLTYLREKGIAVPARLLVEVSW